MNEMNDPAVGNAAARLKSFCQFVNDRDKTPPRNIAVAILLGHGQDRVVSGLRYHAETDIQEVDRLRPGRVARKAMAREFRSPYAGSSPAPVSIVSVSQPTTALHHIPCDMVHAANALGTPALRRVACSIPQARQSLQRRTGWIITVTKGVRKRPAPGCAALCGRIRQCETGSSCSPTPLPWRPPLANMQTRRNPART